MGKDGIVVAGVLGILAVIAIWRWADAILWALGWPRRYLRARGYEHELARHTARALLDEIERPATYATVTIARAEVTGKPPWPDLEPLPPDELGPLAAQWQSAIEAAGEPLPEWADPYADRVGAYGLNSGSSGSDYHGGQFSPWGKRPAPAGNGTGDAGQGEPGSEPYGAPVPAPLILPPGWSQPALPFPGDPDPDDPALDVTWARLVAAWDGAELPVRGDDQDRDGGCAPTESRPAARADVTSVLSPRPFKEATQALSALPPGWAPSKLGTRFDVELAAECARYAREQDADVTDYLERLLGVTW